MFGPPRGDNVALGNFCTTARYVWGVLLLGLFFVDFLASSNKVVVVFAQRLHCLLIGQKSHKIFVLQTSWQVFPQVLSIKCCIIYRESNYMNHEILLNLIMALCHNII